MVSTADVKPPQGGGAVPGTSVERAAAYMLELERRHAAAAAAAAAGTPPQERQVGSYPGRLSTQAKNRRWAKMQLLESSGDFFSETAMRQRAPGLWHEHIGRHEGGPPPGAEPTAAGESWAASLLRANDAAEAQMAIEAEAAKDNAAMSEHDSDEDVSDGGGGGGGRALVNGARGAEARAPPGGEGGGGGAAAAAAAAPGPGSLEAAAQRRHDFLVDMRARFLCGEDGEYVDYAAIDADTSLDDEEHVRRQQEQDAEDAYFDDVMDDME